MKVARMVLPGGGGKFAKTYLSEFGIFKKNPVNLFKCIYRLPLFFLSIPRGNPVQQGNQKKSTSEKSGKGGGGKKPIAPVSKYRKYSTSVKQESTFTTSSGLTLTNAFIE